MPENETPEKNDSKDQNPKGKAAGNENNDNSPNTTVTPELEWPNRP
jgi:hypothetical protein